MKLPHIILLAFALTLFSCTNNGKQTADTEDRSYGFEQNFQKLTVEQQEEFNSITATMLPEHKEALKFLYAHMTLADIVDYSPAFYKEIVEYSFKTQEAFSWKVPETEFYHFVLPHRVNNENLDTARKFFFHQLKERLQGMSMLDAALEVNHWCHEHVAYRAADERTSSPLATYKNGYGRCGEESTFTVTALRSVGIPARQVYTPRWAHTDDNHAWVEFWADGKWYYYGACEPEAVANLGWFTEPARRAMLVNTRVVGDYQGSERILKKEDHYAILNTLSVYAQTKEVHVQVLDKEKKAVQDAKVEYLLYNYSEFYPIAAKYTNESGMSSFESGLGDIIVWASKNGAYAFQKISMAEVDTLELTISKDPKESAYMEFDMHPPVAKTPLEVPQDKKLENKKRLAYEDSLRAVYETGFINEEQSGVLAKENNLPAEELWPLIQKSRANWDELEIFIRKAPENKKALALELLKVVNEKDLRDARAEILLDHLKHTNTYTEKMAISEEDYYRYVLRPRVRYEMLLPYRALLQEAFGTENKKPEDLAAMLIDWVDKNIELDNTNFYRVPISPAGVFRSGRADKFSMNVFFIAACRSMHLPARNEPGTMKPQYLDSKGNWITVDLVEDEKESGKELKQGTMAFASSNPGLKYFKDFTLSKMTDGSFRTLEYDWDKELSSFSDSIPLDEGYYRLTTGHRLSDGTVLSAFSFIHIKAGAHTVIEVEPRQNPKQAEALAQLPEGLMQSCTLSPYQVMIWMDPGTEPAKHVVQDIAALAKQFEEKGIPVSIFFKDIAQENDLDPDYFNHLPTTRSYMEDVDWKGLESVEGALKLSARNLPTVILLKKSDIIFYSQGYRIGIGDEIIKISQ